MSQADIEQFQNSSGVPEYLQSDPRSQDFCDIWTSAIERAENSTREQTMEKLADKIWATIRAEAEGDAKNEPVLSSFLYASILAHQNFSQSVSFIMANRLASQTMLPTQLLALFQDIITTDADVRYGVLTDLQAFRERDPACGSYSNALLYFKGFHAIQGQRLSNALWRQGRTILALALQSRISEVLAVDIHPAAKLGRGILLDHGTGVVIGETAVVGDNVSLLQGVTLGGTGKEDGDRHPKIGDNVLIGAQATILGNIRIGRGAQIAAGSLVLKEVPAHTLVAGSPAAVVTKVTGSPALNMQQWVKNLEWDPYSTKPSQPQPTSSNSGPPSTASSPASNGSSPSTSTAPTANQKSSKSAVNGSWPSEDLLKNSSPASIAGIEQGKPKEVEKVEATSDDWEAEKRWGTENMPPPEYSV